VLAGAIAAVWCLSYGRTSLGAWRVPVDYYGDSIGHTLAYLKASLDGAVRPLGVLTVPSLNAPFDANWNDFPRQHHVQFWAAGWLARGLGLFPTANLLLLLAHVLAAVSFYGVARYFRARWEWAFVGAAAFGLSPFLFYRSLAHLNLSYDWPIPLGVLVVTWCFGRRGLQPGSRRFAVALAVAAVTGFHHVYYVGLLGQFLVLASVMQALRRGRLAAIAAPLVVALMLIAGAALDNAGTFAYVWQHGRNAGGLVRPYGGLERFALKPIELVLPTGDTGLVPWRTLSTAYYHLALYRGELGSAYLGLAGIGALAWLVLSSLTARSGRPVPAQGTRRALAWLLVYAVVGGVNGLLGTLGFVWFRATNRYSIWMLALLLLWAAVRLSRAGWTRRRPASLAAAAAACALVLLDQVPWHDPREAIHRWAGATTSDRLLVRSLEAALPRGAMLFQLPVADCPEGLRIGNAVPHEHFRPYLYAETLRFSYGTDKGRPREAWQRRVEALPPEAMARALEQIGFAGLLVNRKGYEDGGDELRRRMAAAGRSEAWESADRDFLFIRLTPVPSPALPDVVVPAAATPDPAP
jgi:hypothetical protein